MHVNRGMLGWGIFLIALGAVPATVRAGALDASVARRAWELWPLLLVGAGLGLALARTRAAAAGGLVAALVVGLMAGGLVAGGFGTANGLALCGSGSTGQGAAPHPPATGTFAGSADVQLTVDCGSLAVGTADGRDWSVGWSSGDGRTPAIDSGSDRLAVRAAPRTGFGIGSTPSSWTVTLPRDPVLTLGISVNAGSATASLAGMHLDSLDASVNAGDARLDLTGATGVRTVNASVNLGSLSVTLPQPDGRLTGSLSANAGSLQICVPAGVALVIRTGDHPLGSDNLAGRGMTRNGDGTWTRGDVLIAANRIDLSLDANLGSITLDPENGCG